VAFLATPAAIRIARRADFLDHPRGYRRHTAPTPLLGGAAVLVAFLIAAVALGDVSGKLLVPVGCAVGFWLLGTVDDRVAVAPKWRLLAAAGAAVALYASGLGWNTAASDPVDLSLTVVWIVGLVNAFNLMDNLDGACATVAAVAAAGIGALALIKGYSMIGGLAFALSGACAGFLPWNLCRPAKIFLGDGGSMPIGFLIAALAMVASRHAQGGNAGILVGALLVGIPILDVALVSFSRTRRGVALVTGGRDHLTHRILLVLRSPRSVAAALAVGQGVLCSLAILGYELGSGAVVGFALAAFVAGVAAVVVLDSQRWRPAGIAVAEEPASAERARSESIQVEHVQG
jgi:UDP-GlcNAc:undecaprenyl-phosphate GlcNAc-1-phosphate transferase